jgi:hypothetical protein
MYKTIIFLVVLYGRETWSLILRDINRGCLRAGAEENISTEERLSDRRLEKTE